MAWVCRNLYSFEDHCFRQMVDLIGLGATVGFGTRLSKLQLLVNAVSGGCRNGGSDGRFHLLFEAVQEVCNRNPNSFLAGEMLWWGVGQTPRPQYECAWHIDKDVGNGAHCDRIRVDLPITAAAKRAPFCNCRGSSSRKSVLRTSTKENKNKGRTFFSCSGGFQPGRGCNFFMWDEVAPAETHILLPIVD